MTDTKKKATVLDLDAFRALAPKMPGKFDVSYRVNMPTKVPKYYGSPAYEDRPGPAFYLLTPNGGGYSHNQGASASFAQATNGRHYAYLDPLLGKLLADAEYTKGWTRARGLARMLEDVEKEVKKYLPEDLAALGATEAARMAAEAKAGARKTIREKAVGFLNALDQLGDVAGLTAEEGLREVGFRNNAVTATKQVAQLLKTDKDPDIDDVEL